MAPGYLDDLSSEESSLTKLTSSADERDHRHRSPNVASVRKVMREEHRKEVEHDGDSASFDLGLNTRKQHNERRRARRTTSSSSSPSSSLTSSISTDTESNLNSSMGSSSVQQRRATRRVAAQHRKRSTSSEDSNSYTSSHSSSSSSSKHHMHTGVIAADASPQRRPPRPAPKQELEVNESDEDEFMHIVHKSENQRLPIFIPSERIQQEEWFPMRKQMGSDHLGIQHDLPPYRPPTHAVLPPELIGEASSTSSELEPEPPVSDHERKVSTSTSSSSSLTSSSSSVKSEVEIPEWLQNAAHAEMIGTECLQPLLKAEGLGVRSVTTLLKSNKFLLESFPARLFLSPKEPILKMTNPEDDKSRLLLPDPYSLPVTNSPAAGGNNGNPMSPFSGYEFPTVRDRGEHISIADQLIQKPGLISYFRNLRTPCWFELEDEKHMNDLHKAIVIVNRAILTKQERARSAFSPQTYIRPPCLPPPTVLNGPRKEMLMAKLRPDHRALESLTGDLLDDSCRRLVTSRAVSFYWKTDVSSWCTFYSTGAGSNVNAAAKTLPPNGPKEKGKWKRVHLRIWIHPYTNDLIVSDKDGGVLGPVVDLTDYSAALRTLNSNDEQIPLDIAVMNKNCHMTYLCYYKGIAVNEDKLWLAFESLERLKDFQQTLATCQFLKERRQVLSNQEVKERTDHGLF